ncbi:regulatory LuxR family protein [Flavobacteriaceae bacterium MAR_2010_72]|nr:regulatory LuxR family protein [Flavobacteriaceae bacterium MAR_2010_72]TVZ58831.1 regulatory LuxR family protein [Flavobacteriaceae bacterium MAR_2010_105]
MCARAQHAFSGIVDKERWQSNVYLSVIEDYRKLSGVFSEQIISRQHPDSSGNFLFTGNQLDSENRIYRIHVDNCNDAEQNQNHFNGHCKDSKEILFIAKGNDTINFPFSFDNQMFCTVSSGNPKADAFVQVDSLKEIMKYDYGEFRSEANRKLNNRKWFKTLQDFGKSLNEPLAELYIYAFLSERGNNFHQYYLEDLKTNPYYSNLLKRLKEAYPNSDYTKQYENELTSDQFSIQSSPLNSEKPASLILWIICGISIVLNIVLLIKLFKKKQSSKIDLTSLLTKQEHNILDLLLEDKSNKDIAEALFVSLSTVKTHVNNIYKKLNVQSRLEAKELFNK